MNRPANNGYSTLVDTETNSRYNIAISNKGASTIDIDERYLEAAKIIANCKPERLPFVLEALKLGGFDLNPDNIRLGNTISKNRLNWICEKRSVEDRSDWQPSDDEIIASLRESYSNGINLSLVAKLSGIGRTSLYKTIKRGYFANETTRRNILNAIRSIATDQ